MKSNSIDAEIPAESKVVVLTLYRIWLLLLLVLIANLVGCILLLVSGQDDGAKDVRLSSSISVHNGRGRRTDGRRNSLHAGHSRPQLSPLVPTHLVSLLPLPNVLETYD